MSFNIKPVPNVHGPEALAPMLKASRMARQCLREVGKLVRAGLPTKALDDAVIEFCKARNVTSGCYQLYGFPGHCCTSLNNEVAHGRPSPDVVLKYGDLLKVDVSLCVDGWHGDTCATFHVNRPYLLPYSDAQRDADIASLDLLMTAKKALQVGVKAARPFGTTSDIGNAIGAFVAKTSFSAVEVIGGHGIGKSLHEPPVVLHSFTRDKGALLVPGMFITIEPMINEGSPDIEQTSEEVFVTRDGKRSAQFEHTIAITDSGCQILTL